MPEGRLVVITVGAGFMVMFRFLLTVWFTVAPVLSSSVTATEKVPETVGLPVMTPVLALSASPAGRAPTPEAGMDQVRVPAGIPLELRVAL